MQHLLDLGMDINGIERVGPPDSTDVGRGTPLHSVVYIGKTERVAFLLEQGVDKEVINEFGQDVMRFAEVQESWESLQILQVKLQDSAAIDIEG